jgi:hypothetical protein
MLSIRYNAGNIMEKTSLIGAQTNVRPRLLSVVVVMAGCAAAWGQLPPATGPTTSIAAPSVTAADRSPTSAPASRPATHVTVDASTPRAAVRTFASALQAGDGDALRAVMFAADPSEQRMLEATIDLTESYAAFRRAAEAQFGAKEYNEAMGDPDGRQRAAMARIDITTETIDGDKATLSLPDEPPTILYRRQGKWQVVIGSLSPSDSPEAIEARAHGLERQAAAIDDITEEIDAAKYRSMREVLTILHGQMMKAAVDSPEEAAPTTAPDGR